MSLMCCISLPPMSKEYDCSGNRIFKNKKQKPTKMQVKVKLEASKKGVLSLVIDIPECEDLQSQVLAAFLNNGLMSGFEVTEKSKRDKQSCKKRKQLILKVNEG